MPRPLMLPTLLSDCLKPGLISFLIVYCFGFMPIWLNLIFENRSAFFRVRKFYHLAVFSRFLAILSCSKVFALASKV